MVTLGFIALTYIDAQLNITSGSGSKTILYMDQITGHQSKQIAGLGKRVFPYSIMTPVIKITMICQIAI